MKVFTTIKDLKAALDTYRSAGESIGFVPTMGALHEGHLSLLRKCKEQNTISVVSIFVNPTQFNDKQDLTNYPRNFNKDCDLLIEEACDIVFAPEVTEMYPQEDTRQFDFGQMDQVMEGKHRPGHFNGVAQIVSKLFDAVEAHRAYFGQKDFQQLAIIRKLAELGKYSTEIIGCPIVREADGLAMSSRNMLLSAEHRNAAPRIYQTLQKAKQMVRSHAVSEITAMVKREVESCGLLRLEYFEIVQTDSLQTLSEITAEIPATACIAVFAGKVRLIDNLEFIPHKK